MPNHEELEIKVTRAHDKPAAVNVIENKVRRMLGPMHNPGAPGLDAPRSYCVLTIIDWRSQVAMAKHAPPDKGEGDIFGKEDSPDFGGNIGKGVSHAAYNKIFK